MWRSFPCLSPKQCIWIMRCWLGNVPEHGCEAMRKVWLDVATPDSSSCEALYHPSQEFILRGDINNVWLPMKGSQWQTKAQSHQGSPWGTSEFMAFPYSTWVRDCLQANTLYHNSHTGKFTLFLMAPDSHEGGASPTLWYLPKPRRPCAIRANLHTNSWVERLKPQAHDFSEMTTPRRKRGVGGPEIYSLGSWSTKI